MRENIVNRLRLDPGQLTLGQLIQDREAARIEIERLERELEGLKAKVSARVPAKAEASKNSAQWQHTGTVLIGIGDLCKRIGVSRATIYRWMREGTFPLPVRISPGAVRWRSEDFEQWRTSLPVNQ